MQAKTFVFVAALWSVFAVSGSAASLAGTSVTGSLVFNDGDPSNYFDPGYGFVPPTDLNYSGTTVTISDSAVEFGFDDGVSNAFSADFTNNQLTITDSVEGTGSNVGFTMTFTDTAFKNLYLLPLNTLSLIGSYSITGDVLTLTSPGGNVTQGQSFTDTFDFAQVPEPSGLGLLGVALVAFGCFAKRIIHTHAEN